MISRGTTLTTIVIHAFALTAIVHFVRRQRRLGRVGVRFGRDVAIVASAMLLALTAHLVEITIWATVFAFCRRIRPTQPRLLSLGDELHHSGLC